MSDAREPGRGLVHRRCVLIERGGRWCAVITLAAVALTGCRSAQRASVPASHPPSSSASSAVSFVPGPAGGPSNVIATAAGKISATISGQASVVHVNAAFIIGPLTEAEVDFTSLGAPVAASITGPLIAKIAARAVAVAAA